MIKKIFFKNLNHLIILSYFIIFTIGIIIIFRFENELWIAFFNIFLTIPPFFYAYIISKSQGDVLNKIDENINEQKLILDKINENIRVKGIEDFKKISENLNLSKLDELKKDTKNDIENKLKEIISPESNLNLKINEFKNVNEDFQIKRK